MAEHGHLSELPGGALLFVTAELVSDALRALLSQRWSVVIFASGMIKSDKRDMHAL